MFNIPDFENLFKLDFNLLWFIAPFIVHELAHFVSSILVGKQIKFRFSFGKLFGVIPLPRYIWDHPANISKGKLRFICQSGFVLELGLILFLPLHYQVMALLHFVMYPWYSGEVTDFNGY